MIGKKFKLKSGQPGIWTVCKKRGQMIIVLAPTGNRKYTYNKATFQDKFKPIE